VVWRELLTRDEARVRAFYGALFGWTYEDVDLATGEHYTLIALGEERVGGMRPLGLDKTTPPRWLSYVSVPDVEGVAKLAVAHGGKLVRGPADIRNFGRFVVMQDFAGALIAAVQESQEEAAPEPPRPGEFCWESLGTPDVERAKSFYGKLFGWKTTKGPEGIVARFSTDGSAQGNVADLLENKEYSPAWIPHVRVEKLGPVIDRVSELGGEVEAVFSAPRVARIAIIQDPAGGGLSLYEPTSR
jgi:predicted enzyme related to lactoylglutathione lyase